MLMTTGTKDNSEVSDLRMPMCVSVQARRCFLAYEPCPPIPRKVLQAPRYLKACLVSAGGVHFCCTGMLKGVPYDVAQCETTKTMRES